MNLLERLGLKKLEPEEKKKLIINITAFFVLALISAVIIAPVIAYEIIYRDKIYAGVYIDGLNVGGLTKDQAIAVLNRNTDKLRQSGLDFNYNNQVFNLPFIAVSPTDPDLAFEILNFSAEKMADSAFAYGRHFGRLTAVIDQLIALLNKAELPVKYDLNEAELKNALVEKFGSLERPAEDAKLFFGEAGAIKVLPDSDGFVIDYDRAIKDLKKNINLLAINDVQVKTNPSVAQVRQAEAEKLIPQVEELLNLGKLTLHYQDNSWPIEPSEYRSWLNFKKDGNSVALEFSPQLAGKKLEAIGQEINVPPQNAKFQMADNKVTEFKPALPGLELDQEASLSRLNQEFIIDKKTEVSLAVKESAPDNRTADSNTLGIKELIGKGVSDFAGSHTNRIKNIKNAVNHLNGLIIPPGEFSIVEAIGDVTAETGYFPEFVIKGDRTIPEYGGGLCQIGTTVFRAALYSGLPIIERRPHSYIVSYYKPIGMDATIYGPHPDVRFLNDTGNNILLQIKIKGTELTFEFWGTGDGRKVEITDPKLFNWTAQPADRLIENPELKPGDKILKETGRRGADASFYRYITPANGEKKEEIFRSHYVPWPNIYEIGVTPKPEVLPVTEGTSEPATSDSSQAGQSGATNQNINTAQ